MDDRAAKLAATVDQVLKNTDWDAVRSPFPNQVPELAPELYDQLEELAKTDFQKAVDVWERYVPVDMARPAVIDPQYKAQTAELRAVSDALNGTAAEGHQGPMTFHIPDENMSRFRATIERINRRAVKLGFAATSCKELDTYVKKGHYLDENNIRVEAMTTFHVIELEGEQPVLSGWRFLGKLEHLDMQGTNLIKGEVPKQFHSCPPNCDHCNKLRNRAETFILQNVENGNLMQVGRSCLTDFFNSDDPMRHASFLQLMFGLKEELEEMEDYSFGMHSARAYEAIEALWTAAILIERQGWINPAKADELGCVSTGQLVRLVMTGTESLHKITDSERQFAQEKAEKVLQWLSSDETAEQAADNTYLHNLVVLAKTGSVDKKNLGLLGSAVVAYDRHLQKKENEALAGVSEHVGAVDEKIDSLPVTIVGTTLIPGNMYGDKTLYRFRDNDKNLLVWFCSGADIGHVGDRLHVNGTITEHSVYRDQKQTVLQRVTSNEGKLCDAVWAKRDISTIKKLLKKPVNVNHFSYKDQMTPLMYAARNNDVDTMRLLLDAGAEPDRDNPEHSAPLLLAATLGNQECVDMLLEYGADPNKLDRRGLTLAQTQEDAQEYFTVKVGLYATRCPVEHGRCEPREAIWANVGKFDLAKIEPVHGDWAEWFGVEAAKAEEAGNDWSIRAIAEGSYADEPIIVLQRDGKAYIWDGEKRVGAALRRGEKTLPAIVGTYSPEMSKQLEQKNSNNQTNDLSV